MRNQGAHTKIPISTEHMTVITIEDWPNFLNVSHCENLTQFFTSMALLFVFCKNCKTVILFSLNVVVEMVRSQVHAQ